MKKTIISGTYESAESILCSQIITSRDRVLELGGAIGFIGLYCLINCNVESVVSVEANSATVDRLRKSYELNNRVPNVIEAALWARNEPVEFCVSSEFWTDGLPDDSSSANRIMVHGKSFDTLFAEAGGNANVLVVDVEGGERFIEWSSLPASIEKVIIELHPDILGVRESFQMLRILQDQGFDIVGRVGDAFALIRQTRQQKVAA